MTTHNAYWWGVEGCNVSSHPCEEGFGSLDFYATGPKQHLLDDLYIDRARGLELDLHGHHENETWDVHHTIGRELPGGLGLAYSVCPVFDDCLGVLRAFHYSNPNHDVVFVHLEAKEIVDATDFLHAPLSPVLLDQKITQALPVFGPSDYYQWCERRYRMANRPFDRPAPLSNPQVALGFCGWPTMRELRGQFIFTLHGNDLQYGSVSTPTGAVTFAAYNYSHGVKTYGRDFGPITERKIFPMIGREQIFDRSFDVPLFWEGYDFYPFDRGEWTRWADLRGMNRGGFGSDAQFPGQFEGAILARDGVSGFPGHNLVPTDAPRNMPVSYKYEDLQSVFDNRQCGGSTEFGATARAEGLNWSSGCLFNRDGSYMSDIDTLTGEVKTCDPQALRENNSGIFLSVNGPWATGVDGPGNDLVFLAKPISYGEPTSLSAFVSTRTSASQGHEDTENPFYGMRFGDENCFASPCDGSCSPAQVVDLGRTYTGHWGCLMARRDLLDASATFVAVCREGHLYDSRVVWFFRRDGEALQQVGGAETAPHDSGYGEVLPFLRLEHSADGRCWKGFVSSNPDPSSVGLWAERQLGNTECFSEPLGHVGLAGDGAGHPEFDGRGDYLFANVKYDGAQVRLDGADPLSRKVISESGNVQLNHVDDRSYVSDESPPLVRIDTGAPFCPSRFSDWRSDGQVVTVTAADAQSDVTGLWIRSFYDQPRGGPCPPSPPRCGRLCGATFCDPAGYQFYPGAQQTITLHGPASYILEVFAEDSAGNRGVSEGVRLYVLGQDDDDVAKAAVGCQLAEYHKGLYTHTGWLNPGDPARENSARRLLRAMYYKMNRGLELMSQAQDRPASRRFLAAARKVSSLERKSDIAFRRALIDAATDSAIHDIGGSLRNGLLYLSGEPVAPPTSTTSIPTTASTSTTTTTTAPPPPACSDTYPACNGTCPSGQACEQDCIDLPCRCVCVTPPPPCSGASFPACNGTCAPGLYCAESGGVSCACVSP
jgi:hypothetical protein